MKKLLFTIAALFCTTLLFAQEYMVVENHAGGYSSFDVSIIKQATFVNYPASGEGTKESPFNVAAANAKCKEIGQEPSADNYYVKGYVISSGRNSNGPAAYIADDMTGINRLYVYQVTLPNNVTLNYGDEVIIYGCLYNYRAVTPEMEGYVVNINGQPYEDAAPQGSGTLSDPYNVAAVVNYVKSLGADVESLNDVYITGIITDINEPFGTTYGNATFKIADTENSSTTFQIYRCLYLGNVKYTDETAQNIKLGDRVLMCGKVVNYRGTTPETVQNKAYVVSINSSQTGDEATPVTVAQFNEAAVNTDVWYKLTGTVNNLKDNDQYGNFDLVDETGSVYVYGLLSEKGGAKKKFQELVATYGIANGKKITIIGNRGEYNGNIEVTNAYFVSIEGGAPTQSSDHGTAEAPLTVAQAMALIDAESVIDEAYVKGKISKIDSYNATYKSITYWISDDGGTTTQLQVYSGKGLNGEDFTSKDDLTVGQTVVIKGKLKMYNTTYEFDKSSIIISIDGQGAGGESGGTGGSEAVSSLTNGNFETWADGLPTGWKSASSASSATLEQSTDAHGGSYACIVKGDASANKRLASQEIKLAAGSYNFSFWVKPTTENKAQVRPGYVPVIDGTAGAYKYDLYATLNAGWQQVSYDFTLDAETTICLVVMNPKASSYSSGEDVIIDDATLTKK